jgi:mannose-6-phosphate isomerase-like protein (cupin superfamily)
MKTVIHLTYLMALGAIANRGQAQAQPDSATNQRDGLVLQESEGEHRMRRPRPSVPLALGGFIIKVDQKNGGSNDLWMGYEDIPAGRAIRPHHHPYSGEILFIQRGTGLASVGSREALVGPGSMVYIPRNTRVSLRNTSEGSLTLAFIFAQPGIGEYFRETSVPQGDSAPPVSEEELAAIRARHREHITFDSLAGANGSGLILQPSEGEARLQRPPPAGVQGLSTPFLIKVDPKNGNSPDLVMLYRDIEPGKAIAPHHHPSMGEILFVHRGSGVASLGSRDAPVTAGTTIYISPNARVSLRNTGAEPLTTVAIFPQPGFEDYIRDVSVPAGTPAPPLTAEELSAIRKKHRAHVVFDKP